MNSTASALSKLTTRLNFLKERRGQLNAANAVGSPVHKGSENAQSSRSTDKTQGPETRAAQNSDTGSNVQSTHCFNERAMILIHFLDL